MNIMYYTDMKKHNITLLEDAAKLVDELVDEYERQQGVHLSRPQAIVYACKIALALLLKKDK